MKRKIACLQNVLTSFFLLISIFAVAQDYPITGKITDDANKPLEGVTIQVKGTKTVTLSKKDGSFSITAPSANSVLVFTSVGFREQEVPINGKTQLDFT